jgi:hypothetical protein
MSTSRGSTAAAVVAAVMLVSAGGRANFRDGNELYSDCTSSNYQDRVLCYGYVMAIADASGGGPRAVGSVFGFRQCGLDRVSAEQMTDIVVRYLVAHPERRDFGAAGLVADALSKAWPCR